MALAMLGLDQQTLWFCRWGTVIALVWATSIENAELRVRHQCFNRRTTIYDILSRPVAIKGEVLIRAATDEDREVFTEWGGEVPA